MSDGPWMNRLAIACSFFFSRKGEHCRRWEEFYRSGTPFIGNYLGRMGVESLLTRIESWHLFRLDTKLSWHERRRQGFHLRTSVAALSLLTISLSI